MSLSKDYDNLTNQFASDNDAEVYIGVFDGEPEISFKVKSHKQAYDLMTKYNQKSLWNNQEKEIEENPYTEPLIRIVYLMRIFVATGYQGLTMNKKSWHVLEKECMKIR